MQHNEGLFSRTRFNGVVVKQINAQPGREPTGYRLRDPEPGCSCDDLSGQGCCAVALLLIFGCWPCAFLPCCMPDCKTQYQVPVYTVPDATLPQVPEVPEAVMGVPIAEELSRTKA